MPLSALHTLKFGALLSSFTFYHIPPSSPSRNLSFPRKFHSFSSSREPRSVGNDAVGDQVIGDCLVFDDGVFEDPCSGDGLGFDYPLTNEHRADWEASRRVAKVKRKTVTEVQQENLVPEEWRHVQEEWNITKKEKRKTAQQLEFGVRAQKKKEGLAPLRNVDLQEYLAYKEAKLSQLKPVVLDEPCSFPVKDDDRASSHGQLDGSSTSARVMPKNPRWAAYGKGFDYITEFFNSGNYEPGAKKTRQRKLFTKEEKIQLNCRIPDLTVATSRKWQPLHTLAASGEFYLVDALLKHNVDINAVDKDGLTPLHRAIIGKKQALTNYLLRESANPFALDGDGATLIHYAVQTASTPTIKLLLLYNVDINFQDNYGWTPLHLAVQSRRTDVVKLLLIKGADTMLENKDGLTPLDLCLYSGQDTRTYELIKLLKQLPSKRRNP